MRRGEPDVNDLATHLNMSPGSATEELNRFLQAAIKVVEGRCGPVKPGVSTLRCRASGKNLVLPAPPALSRRRP